MNSQTKILALLAGLLALAACDQTRPIACIVNSVGTIVVERDHPAALNGYTYRVCTHPLGSQTCAGYDDLIVERPSLLSVELSGRLAKVDVFGGAIHRFRSDPIGMRDPAYTKAVPMALAFHVGDRAPADGLLLTLDGKRLNGSQTHCS